METIAKQYPYELHKAFTAYEDAVLAFAEARVELDKAGVKLTAAKEHLRDIINAP